MLSSDILEKQFGETKIVILKQDDLRRVIQTIVDRTGEIIELSLVSFEPENTSKFPDIHARIVSGTSIGKAFKEADVHFVRRTNSTSRQVLPDILKTYLSNQQEATIVDVDVFVGEHETHYCRILEIYSGAVEWPDSPATNLSKTANQLNTLERLLAT